MKELFGDRVDLSRSSARILEITAFQNPLDYGEHFRSATARRSSAQATLIATVSGAEFHRRWTVLRGLDARYAEDARFEQEYLVVVGTGSDPRRSVPP